MNDPQLVIDAVIKASLTRPKELPVGLIAKSSYFFQQLFPHLWERVSADVNHHYQVKTAPPAEPTQGALYEPMPTGRGIGGGVRERMKREREEWNAR